MRRFPLIISLCTTTLLCACAEQTQQPSAMPPAPSSQALSEQAASLTPITTGTGAVSQRLLSGGILEIGSATAPLSLVLIINYSSAYSQQFYESLVPQLINDFVQPGKLRINIAPLALKEYPQSFSSAALMLCSAKEGKGKEMNDLLFGSADAATLKKRIDALALSPVALQACEQSADVKNMLTQEAQMEAAYNITLVPSYIIKSRVFTGLPQYSDLKGQIEDALSGQ